jgi:hypothetical protein
VCFERRVIKVRRSVLEPLSLLRSSLQRRNSCQGLARRDRNRGLNDGQIPNFRGVRVALDTGYHRVEGNRRASRNGRVSSSPTRNPERCDSPLLHRLHPKLSRSLSLSVSLSVPLSLSVSVSLSLSVYLSLSRSRSRSLTTRVGVPGGKHEPAAAAVPPPGVRPRAVARALPGGGGARAHAGVRQQDAPVRRARRPAHPAAGEPARVRLQRRGVRRGAPPGVPRPRAPTEAPLRPPLFEGKGVSTSRVMSTRSTLNIIGSFGLFEGKGVSTSRVSPPGAPTTRPEKCPRSQLPQHLRCLMLIMPDAGMEGKGVSPPSSTAHPALSPAAPAP